MHEDVTFAGRTYRRHPNHTARHRWAYFMSTTAPRTYLHRDIWEAAHGPIPEGWHVHHLDHNPLNNNLENLEAIDPQQHLSYHGRNWQTRSTDCRECGATFTTTRPWSTWCTSACKERWRRREGVAYVRPRKGQWLERRECEECSTPYEAKRPWARFCTPACKQRASRREKASA